MSRRLRIAMIAPPWFELPPRGYGGIEYMCSYLVDSLVDRGHHVTLVSSGENGTKAHHVRTYDTPQWRRLGEPMPEVRHAASVRRILDSLDVDVVHDHSLVGPLLAAGRAVPTVVTLHEPVTGDYGEYFRLLGDTVRLVAISEAQRASAPELNWCATVHNGVDPAGFRFQRRKADWVLFLGQCMPHKGMHTAIDAARAAGVAIRIAAKCGEPAEIEYFESEIRPRLDKDVEWLGEVGGERKKALLADASCLLFPIAWDEPFGMVMIEAMASGTPVVALDRGSVREVVTDGLTGIVRDAAADLPNAIRLAAQLDADHCRKAATDAFSSDLMAERYERVYEAALESGHR
ncbi:glycosyltransferase family 4 protein [Streptomyces sp. NPDC056161]|uniref:glycosyltransferase family 4 protein n=1 Tax=Streptomyces sp. NPDC056161 TaxID=3345732 RepID=UPI0035DC8D45